MRLVLLVTLLLVNFSHARMDVKTTGEGEIVLSSNNCTKVREAVAAINSWSKSMKQGGGSCPVKETSWGCESNAYACLPEHVQKYHAKNPEVDGPNCYNLTMVMTGLQKGMCFTSSAEMDMFMNSPLCRQLKNGEDRQPGDVGAIRHFGPNKWLDKSKHKNREWHGFIYVNESVSYSKNGYKKQQPFALQRMESVLDDYFVDSHPACMQNESNKTCKVDVDFFRCMSMEDYLKDGEVLGEIKEALDQTNVICQEMQKGLFDSNHFSQRNNKKAFMRAVDDLVSFVYDYVPPKKQEGLSDKEKFLVGAIKARLDSLGGQGRLMDPVLGKQWAETVYENLLAAKDLL